MTPPNGRRHGPDLAAPSPHLALLTFRLGEQVYGLAVTEVAQIIEMVTLTHLPQTSWAIQGVFNWHGKIVPVIDLRLRLGLPFISYQLHTPIILAHLQGSIVGLIVDRVEEVVDVSATDLETGEMMIPVPLVTPSPGSEQRSYWAGVAKVERRLIPILKVGAILSLEEQTRLVEQVIFNQDKVRGFVNESSF